jgi:hypothetical protein
MKKNCIVLGIVLVLFLMHPLMSQDDNSLAQFNMPSDMQGLKILALSSIKFKPATSTEYQTLEWAFNEVGLTIPSGNPSSATFITQFHLPDGAEIKRIVAMYYDNSASAGIDVAIGYVEPFDTTPPVPTVLFTSDGLPEVDGLRIFQTTTIPDPIIDNRNVYFAYVELDKETMGDVAFRCLWIGYE